MAEIQFVDQTVRDGQQTYWGMRMPAGAISAVAEHIDRTGYYSVDIPVTGALSMVPMRHLQEAPFERLDLFRRSLPNVDLRCARRPGAIGRFSRDPDSINDLWVRTLVKHGVNTFWIMDVHHNVPAMERIARTVADAGAKVVPAIFYALSPVHTDEWYAARIRDFVSWGIADSIYVEDAPGILTPERTRTLAPSLVEAAAGIPLEFHCHDTTGLAPANYVEAINAGIRILHTCSRPLATGPSLPSIEGMLDNLEWLGHSHPIDAKMLPDVATHFGKVATQEGHPIGAPREYSVAPYLHQMPGGMTGTLSAQLREHQMEDRMAEVLRECARVREDLGHPVSATPFSQLMGIQAVLNVTTGDRYSVVPDEVIQFVLGFFGEPPAPINQDVKDRILSTPQAKEWMDWEPPEYTLTELRAEYGGAGISDEELLTRYLGTPEILEGIRKAGPLKRTYEFLDVPTPAGLVQEVMKRQRIGHAHVRVDDAEFTLTRGSSCTSL